jgi:hypothetical protein
MRLAATSLDKIASRLPGAVLQQQGDGLNRVRLVRKFGIKLEDDVIAIGCSGNELENCVAWTARDWTPPSGSRTALASLAHRAWVTRVRNKLLASFQLCS